MADTKETYDPKKSSNIAALQTFFSKDKPAADVPIPPALRKTVEEPVQPTSPTEQNVSPANDPAAVQPAEGQGRQAQAKKSKRRNKSASKAAAPSRENKKSWTVWCDAQKFEDHKYMMFMGGHRTAEDLLDEFHELWIKEHGAIPRR